jgi:HSP20 family protein
VRLTFSRQLEHLDWDSTLENGVLTISGEKRFVREAGDGKAGSRGFERQYGRFERSLALPQSVDPDNVTAHPENGVLTVELPKTAEARPRQIEITQGDERRQLRSGKRERSGA